MSKAVNKKSYKQLPLLWSFGLIGKVCLAIMVVLIPIVAVHQLTKSGHITDMQRTMNVLSGLLAIPLLPLSYLFMRNLVARLTGHYYVMGGSHFSLTDINEKDSRAGTYYFFRDPRKQYTFKSADELSLWFDFLMNCMIAIPTLVISTVIVIILWR